MSQYILRSVFVELGVHNISGTISANSRITVYRSARGVDEDGKKANGFQAYALTEKNFRRAVKMQLMIFKMTAPAPLPVDDSAPAVTTFAGSVDYGDKPETAQVDEDGDLYC